MKRLGLLALAAVLLCCFGCGIDMEPGGPVAGQEPVSLTLMLPQTHYKPFFVQLLAEFEQDHPDIHIEPQLIPDNQWTDVVKAKAAVKEMPDIVRIDKGVLMEIGPELFVSFGPEEPWYDRVIPEQLENKMIGGKLYGLPISSSTSLGVVYNRRIFSEYNLKVPKTLEAFHTVCETLKQKGIIPLYVSDKDSWTTQLAFNLIAPRMVGEDVWKNLETGALLWSQVPEFEPIFQAMVDIRTLGYTNDNGIEATYADALEAISTEEAAMYIAGEFFISDVQEKNPDIDLMVMPIPYGKDILTMVEGPGQFSIFGQSEHIEEAKIFLNWFSQPEHMDIFTSGWGHMPVYKDQQQPLSQCQQVLKEEYVDSGKTVRQIEDILVGVDFSDFWNFQQEMYAGVLSPQEVLEKWDIAYAQQMEAKAAPGWKGRP